MRGFTYDGKDYNSLAEACRELKISYTKVRRLCRHYERAAKDPAVAIKWALGVEKRSWRETRTRSYWRDAKQTTERVCRLKLRSLSHFTGK